MKELIQAIDTLWTTTPASDLHDEVDGKLYLGEAPQESEPPYVVCQIVDDTPDKHFDDSPAMEYVLLQFSLYSSTRSPEQILNMFNYCKALFDDCALTITGYTCVSMAREAANLIRDPENNIWHYAVDYEVILY